MLGSPQVNVTIATSNDSTTTSSANDFRRRVATSNSTTMDPECLDLYTPDISKNISCISPVKLQRENSMSNSETSSSDVSDHNLSMYFKHNIDSVNLSDPNTQKLAIHYLLDKVRDMETLLIDSVKKNEHLHDEVSSLYKQNDALAGENVTLKQMISAQEEAKRILAQEIDDLKYTFDCEKAWYNDVLRQNNKSIADEFKVVKRCGAEIQDRVVALEDYMMEVQALSARNQIQLEIQKEELEKQKDEIIRLEKDLTTTNQYNRRQNLIIDGIPDAVPQHRLEEVCLDIIHGIGFLPVGSYEIVGCHRLRKRQGDVSAPTIIRFVNRKISEFCFRQRWRLKNLNWGWDLNFREDLCDANMAILEKCEKLRSEGKVSKVYTFNGFVRVVRSAKARPIKITHINDVDDICN